MKTKIAIKNENDNNNITKSMNKENVKEFLLEKIKYFNKIIKKHYGRQKYKFFDIIGVNEINTCTQKIRISFKKLELLKTAIINSSDEMYDNFISDLQEIN